MEATDSSTSISLLRRARARDPEAWNRLILLHGPLVYRWARQAGLQDQDAADVGQEVFQVVAARIVEFRRERDGDSFRGWLWTITRNKIGDFIRRQSGRIETIDGTRAHQILQHHVDSLPADPEAGEFDAGRSVLHRALQLIQGEFENRTWQAFWRSVVDGQQAAHIAADLQMTPQAVRQAKYRVLHRLRTELSED